MKAQTSIDPKLIPMLGRKLYRGNPLPILVRELMQNAWDACARKGVDPQVTISLFFVRVEDQKYSNCIVECVDNGIGMTDEQIVNDFLCLGGTGKSELQETGGFGIAKAAIMSHNQWSVMSLDNFVEADDVYEGREVRKVDPIDGTLVTVHLEEVKSDTYQIRKVLDMVMLSDVDIHLKVHGEGRFQTFDYDNPNAGLGNKRRVSLEHTRHWSAWGCDKYSIMDYDGKENDYDIKAKNVFRLNGLVQFCSDGSTGRDINIFFDITPQCRPQDEGYPLTISREGLIGEANDGVGSLIQAHDVNVVQSKRIVTQKARPKIETVRLRSGYFLKGGRTTDYDTEDDIEKIVSSSMGSEVSANELRFEDGGVVNPNDPQANEIALLMQHYESNRETLQRDVAVMRVWERLISICTSSEETFGLGITLDPNLRAQRTEFQNNVYYTINPTIVDDIPTLHGKVLFLWGRACHEAAHRYVSQHNEKFSTMMGTLQGETASAVASVLTELVALMGSRP
jgi:hypothetical protein